MSNLEKKTITVSLNGHKLNVSVLMAKRQAQWIVALHGIQSNKALYEPLFNQSFASNFSLLAIDFIGFGDSDKPEEFSYSVEDQAKIVRQVLDQLGVKQMHLIGHSLGGMVGTLLLPDLGEKILSFSNLEGNLVGADCGASKDTVQFSIEEFESNEYAQLQQRVAESFEPSAPFRSKWLQAIPAKVFYKTSVSIVEWSNSEKLRTIFNTSNVKRLFLYGSKNARKAGVVSDSVEKVEVPDAGHFTLLDQPEFCYRVLGEFINRK
jgi:pimeloyl-ACP methyl ester carboxylesterase